MLLEKFIKIYIYSKIRKIVSAIAQDQFPDIDISEYQNKGLQ